MERTSDERAGRARRPSWPRPLTTAVGICLCSVCVLPVGVVRADDDFESGQLQLELAPGASIATVNARYGTTTLDSLPPLYLVDLPDDSYESEFLDQMENDPEILEAEYCWENETPEGTRQMVVAAVGGTIDDYLDQNLVSRIHLAEIHEHTHGDGIVVAVLDTGVKADHPALEGSILAGGWDFVDNDDNPGDTANEIDDDLDGLVDEGAGHGTMVAGIVHLVAPNARILPIRVLDDEGRGTTFAVAKGIRYAVEHGAQIINFSLGLTQRSGVIRHEISSATAQSVLMAAAAGNLGAEEPVCYPASDSRVFSVAALDSSDVKADFSSWNEDVAMSAPGVGILAPYHDGEYAIGAGTSFASPFIAGQFALLLALDPGQTVDELRETARSGVVDIYQIPENQPYEESLGSGRFDGLETWLHSHPAASAPPQADAQAGAAALLAYPNPSAVGSPVAIDLAGGSSSAGVVGLEIIDPTGRRIRTIGRADLPAIGFPLRWDGRTQAGSIAHPGLYFVKVESLVGGSRVVRSGRLILLP